MTKEKSRRDSRREQILEMFDARKGKVMLKEIADAVGVSRQNVAYILKRHRPDVPRQSPKLRSMPQNLPRCQCCGVVLNVFCDDCLSGPGKSIWVLATEYAARPEITWHRISAAVSCDETLGRKIARAYADRNGLAMPEKE